MRLEVDLWLEKPAKIPINYQYHISRALYKNMLLFAKEFTRSLHDIGYAFGGKAFRMFTFSMLRIRDKEPADGGRSILVKSRRISFYVSTPSKDMYDLLEMSFMHYKAFEIGGTVFRSGGTIGYSDMEFGRSGRFYTISPVVISKRWREKEAKGRRLRETYLDPRDGEYFAFLKRNAERKYIAFRAEMGDSVLETEMELKWNGLSGFALLSKPQSKLITLKEGMPGETKVRGYNFEFELTGPPKLLSFVHAAGLGKLNSMGFGCLEGVE